MKRLLFFIMFLCATLNIVAQSNISEYSLKNVYKRGDATVICATKENEEKYVIQIQQSGSVKAMFVALGSKGDAIVTLETFINKPKQLTCLYKLYNPSDNMAGCFLKQSNATTVVRFYEGMNLNDFAVISLKNLKKIVKWLKEN